MSNVFTAKAGARFVDAEEVVTWIAQRIHPIDNRSPILVTLEKKTALTDENGFQHWLVQPLDGADQAFLKAAWIALPDVQQASEATWPRYRRALADAKRAAGPDAPAWELHPTFQHVREQSIAQQRAVRRTCAEQMEKAFAGGLLRGLRPDHTPASVVQLGVLLSVEDARRWLEGLGYAFHVASGSEQQDGEQRRDWKDHVPAGPRAIMERHMSGKGRRSGNGDSSGGD
ncbi:MAG: hypothetical protein EOO24_31900 [Comamonadaceae bacterium]|nr:MAG: hypothetical protein EOO24_31900 [Comamonadaceae bacterium]